MTTITLPKAQALSGGACNSKVSDWRIEGATSVESGDNIIITGDNLQYISIADMLAAVSAGGEVINFACIIKVATVNMGDIVPEGLPNRQVEGQPVGTFHTWTTWRDAYHPITTYESNSYFGSNPFGVDLTGTELTIVYNNADSTLLTLAEYQTEVLDNL